MLKFGATLLILLIYASFFPAARAGELPPAGSGQSFRDCPECPEMVVIPAGSFKMGSARSHPSRLESEMPQHKVIFAKPFAVGMYAVTFDEWNACVADRGCGGYKPHDEGRSRGDWPVVSVSWHDAKAYVEWLSKKTGKPYRLLSEAEWEYAARAGSVSDTFPDEFWENKAYDDLAGGDKSPAKPNAWGLHSVYGRPVQWVEDCWNDTYKGAPRNGAAWTKGDCTQRILRGGAGEESVRPALRGSYASETRDALWGFRVARAAEQ